MITLIFFIVNIVGFLQHFLQTIIFLVVCTIHGTDLMGYEKAKEILANVNSSKEYKEKCKFYIESAEKAAKNSKRIFVISKQQEEKFKILFPFCSK